jgi:hypothetical protein
VHFENLYSNTLENIKEKIDKLNQQIRNNFKKSIRRNEIEAVIRKPPTKKSLGRDGFTAGLNKTFEEPTPNHFKILHKIQRKLFLGS